jgi:tetratricopeptide (TPR) repeat protein
MKITSPEGAKERSLTRIPEDGIFRFAIAIVLLLAMPRVVAQQPATRSADSTPTTQLHQALALAQHGDQPAAMRLTLQILDRNPKFVPALKLKGMLLEDSGQPAQAGAVYEEALNLAPNDPDLLLKTGIYKLASGDRDQALKLLEHCTKLNPNDGDAQFYLAQAYHLNGQDKPALAAIKVSLKADPNNPTIWQKYGELLCGTGDCESALRWLLKAQHADATLPRIDFEIAAADYKLMDLASAAQFAAHAVTVQPNDVGAWQLLATANVKLAHWQEAKAAFQQLLVFKPNDVDSLLGLGQCEVELKDYPSAVPTLQSVLKMDPTRLQAHFYLSRAFAAMGKNDDAEHEAALHQLMMEQMTFVRSLASEERESAIQDQAHQYLSEHREQDALRLYQEHFKGSSATVADAYVFIGKTYLFMGNTADGLRNLHHALEIDPKVRGAHTYEGILALKSSDLNKAETEFKAELANDPSYQTAIAELGEVRYHQGRWSDAADQIAKSHTMTPELLYLLCDSYFRLGNTKDANLTAELVAAYGHANPALMDELKNLLKSNGQVELAQRLGS